MGRLLFVGNDNNLNANNNLNNNGRFVGIAPQCQDILLMKRYGNLWDRLCSQDNLILAFKKAKKGKTKKQYVVEFEKNLQGNLIVLRTELLLHSYRPKPLKTFVIRDPKTRKISKSDFRDRVIHHALCNVLESIFDKSFVHDSYANRIGKGTLKALERIDYFKRKASKNNSRAVYVLKADIRHYFDAVDHKTLLKIIKRKIKDTKALWLIRVILENHKTKNKGKGMPLGNLTSQFFANVYLNLLDYFVKHNLKAEYYVRYVDDFVILNNSFRELLQYKSRINDFLKEKLLLELHPEKSKIINMRRGITALGFRIFPHNRLIKKSNLGRMRKKLNSFKQLFDRKKMIYDEIYERFEGWLAYIKHANTNDCKRRFVNVFLSLFPGVIADLEITRWIKILKN